MQHLVAAAELQDTHPRLCRLQVAEEHLGCIRTELARGLGVKLNEPIVGKALSSTRGGTVTVIVLAQPQRVKAVASSNKGELRRAVQRRLNERKVESMIFLLPVLHLLSHGPCVRRGFLVELPVAPKGNDGSGVLPPTLP